MGPRPKGPMVCLSARTISNRRVFCFPEGPRARGTVLGRTTGALGGAREDQVGSNEEYIRSQGAVPGRTKGTCAGAREDVNRGSHCLY